MTRAGALAVRSTVFILRRRYDGVTEDGSRLAAPPGLGFKCAAVADLGGVASIGEQYGHWSALLC
jgi:hypothetical protein